MAIYALPSKRRQLFVRSNHKIIFFIDLQSEDRLSFEPAMNFEKLREILYVSGRRMSIFNQIFFLIEVLLLFECLNSLICVLVTQRQTMSIFFLIFLRVIFCKLSKMFPPVRTLVKMITLFNISFFSE